MTVAGILVKYLLESGWCFVGLRQFAHQDPVRLGAVLQRGLLRLLLGRAASFLILLAPRSWSEPGLYALVIALRWLTWSFLDQLIFARGVTLRSLFVGERRRSTAWRFGGVVVSCLADVLPVVQGVWIGSLWV